MGFAPLPETRRPAFRPRGQDHTLGEEREAQGALEAGQALPTSFSWDVPEVSPHKMPFQAQRKLVNETAGSIWPLRKKFKAWVRSKEEMWF